MNTLRYVLYKFILVLLLFYLFQQTFLWPKNYQVSLEFRGNRYYFRGIFISLQMFRGHDIIIVRHWVFTCLEFLNRSDEAEIFFVFKQQSKQMLWPHEKQLRTSMTTLVMMMNLANSRQMWVFKCQDLEVNRVNKADKKTWR